MDDKQIQRLVRMAMEAQSLESPDSAGLFLIAAHRSWARPAIRWAGAVAASLALAAGAWLALRSQRAGPVPGGSPLAGSATPIHPSKAVETTGSVPVVAAAPTTEQRGVLLTIFRDSYGELSCVQWRPHEWGEGKSLAELTPGELLEAGSSAWCDGTASEMVVVALSGPLESVPDTELLAHDLAACISGSSDLCEQEPGTYDSVALSCLPPGVQARAQSITLDLQ